MGSEGRTKETKRETTMAQGTKLSYAELLAKTKHLESKLANLQRAMQEADRHPVTYRTSDWISMPLHRKQVDAVRDILSDKLRFDEYEKMADERRYEEVHECSILPEYQYLLVRYATDEEGNMVSGIQVWGLLPY